MGRYWNKQRKLWIAQVMHEGHRGSKACRTEKEAKQAEADLLKTLKAQVAAEQSEDQAPATLRLLCDSYALDLDRRAKSPDSIARAKDTKKRLEECFGKRMDEPLTKFTEADVYGFREYRTTGGVKGGTINRDLRSLRAMLKKALPGFRFPAGVFFKEDETRVRWLKPEDEVLVFASMGSPFREMARLAALTLMRLSETRLLRRDQVDLFQGVITLPKSKTGPGQVVLNAEARDLLQQQLDGHASEWVFPAPHGRPYSRVHVGRIWRKASRAAGLTDFHFHDLRHDGATKALNAGYSAPIVMALGRWKTERMMQRYAVVTDKTLRQAAEAVAGNIGQSDRKPATAFANA
jgi:integrase